MTSASEPQGSIAEALAHTERLLVDRPQLAIEQAREILLAAPNHPPATLLLGLAQRAAGDPAAAAATLRALVDAQHRWALAHYELGLTLSELDQLGPAAEMLERAAQLKPDLPDVWRALADLRAARGDGQGADAAYAAHIKASTQDPRLLAPAAALFENRIPEAETLLRAHLQQFPTDVAALRMLAEVAARLGRMQDAEQLLARCLELAPGFNAARHHYAIVLNRQNKPAAALAELERLLAEEPRNPAYRNLKAVVLARIGDFQESIDIYAELLAKHPQHAKIWMSYGHALSTAGRTKESIDAYRRSIALQPTFGEAYWSLANLKTFRFSAADLATLQGMAVRSDLKDEDRFHFQFALGKALEDAGSYAESFRHYQQGNALRRAGISYSSARTAQLVGSSRQLFSAGFFAARAGWGSQQPDPIFIVGMPRAGSTLIEQILASHSRVEGTMELPHVFNTARLLANRYGALSATAEAGGVAEADGAGDEGGGVGAQYPQILADMQAADFLALGEQYLEQTRIYRHLGKPFFIDKLPNNFMHVGLIHLMLPRARIIDARRHPMACCFSGFKQHFARGQNYSYTLEDIGHYYADYVRLMAHFDAVLPGRMHRVIYEDMVEHTETQVRRLLAYCGLEFEPACLRFYENERAVKTPSAQQVRRPIFREGIDHWRHFEPWLSPLAAALGRVLEAYPGVPEF